MTFHAAMGLGSNAHLQRCTARATQGYRGIGFVTFTSADSVEKVMAVKHWMNGHEIAIDRATPKEEPSILKSLFARLPLSTGQRRSFDNGARRGVGAAASSDQRRSCLLRQADAFFPRVTCRCHLHACHTHRAWPCLCVHAHARLAIHVCACTSAPGLICVCVCMSAQPYFCVCMLMGAWPRTLV